MVTVCCNDNMSKVETRRARLRMLIAEYGLSELAEKTGKPASQLNDMAAGRKSFGEKIADQLTAKTGLPTGWFELWIGDEAPEKFMGAAEVVEPAAPGWRQASKETQPNHIGASAHSIARNEESQRHGKLNIDRGSEIESIHDAINTLADKNRLDTEAIAALTALLQLIDSKKDQ